MGCLAIKNNGGYPARLIELLMPRWNAFIAHEPTARQHACLLLDEKREVLYGGAAGGGKSDFILMAALQYADVPGYSALIMRRTFSQLSKADGLLLRAEEWLAGKAQPAERIGGIPTRWVFPHGGRLEFGHCQYEKDRFDYQSAAYQFIGFDELTQFTERIYLYLFSRCRRPKDASKALSHVPLRIRGASNPGGEGHDWVKRRFLDDRDPQRAFVPAKLEDNPYLDRESYADTLMELHPYERAQLLNGDWNIRPPGSKFKREWFELIDAVPGDIFKQVRYWDLAGTAAERGTDPDWTSGVQMGKTSCGRFVIPDVQRFRATPRDVERRVIQTARLDGVPTSIVIEQEPGSSGKFVIAGFVRLLAGFTVRGHRPTGDKFVRMNPLASQAEAGNVLLVRGPWVEPFLQELEQISDDDTHAHDDQADAAAGAFEQLASGGLTPHDLYGGDDEEEARAMA